MIEQHKKLPHFELTGGILNCCFEVMKEVRPGFLENVYKNGPSIAMTEGAAGRSGEVFGSCFSITT